MENNQMDTTSSPLFAAVRGAIQVAEDNAELIDAAVNKLYEALLKANELEESKIAMILITQTGDLSTRNPAAGLRKGGHAAFTPLFCMQELEIQGMLERVIRVMLVTNSAIEKSVVPIYLDGAEKLRPDLALK